jgi:hypothetical protein
MAWRSWPSSTSCSVSTTVITKDIAIQQYKAHSSIYHTCFLLGYVSELLKLLLQLRGSTRQLLGLATQLFRRSHQLIG